MENKRLYVFALASWFVLMVFAIINAGIREGLYTTVFDELQAHQLSTFTLMVIIVFYTYLLLRFGGVRISEGQAVVIGAVWMVATLAFEFLAGHFVFGNSWDSLIADYDLLAGRVWVLIPLTTLITPYMIRRIV